MTLAALIVSAVALAPSAALVRLPSPAQLVAADRSGDALELERAATRLGAARLERIAALGHERDERLAALHGLGLVDDGWARLPEVARLIADSDGEVAAAAAWCARRLSESLTPELLEADEVPADVPARAAQELTGDATQKTLATALRVPAIEALAALRTATRVDDRALVALLGDGDADVRRAAAEALANARAGEQPLAEALAKDPALPVAAAAGAAICRDLPLVAPAGKPSEALARLTERVGKLPAAARARLRALAGDDKVSLADRLDLVTCLRVNKQAADQETLDALARKPPESLRRRARALGGR